MPGTNAGTGCPLTFICAKCRVVERRRYYWKYKSRGLDVYDFHVTGRRRYRFTGNGGSGRVDPGYQYEYECIAPGCGHVGWSRHIQVKREWLREFGDND